MLVRLSNVGTEGEDGGSRAGDAGVFALSPSNGVGCLFSLLVADFQQPTTLNSKQSLIFFYPPFTLSMVHFCLFSL